MSKATQSDQAGDRSIDYGCRACSRGWAVVAWDGGGTWGEIHFCPFCGSTDLEEMEDGSNV